MSRSTELELDRDLLPCLRFDCLRLEESRVEEECSDVRFSSMRRRTFLSLVGERERLLFRESSLECWRSRTRACGSAEGAVRVIVDLGGIVFC